MMKPTIYRCTGRTGGAQGKCGWIGYDDASAAAHHEETDHNCEIWEDVTPEDLHAMAEACTAHARDLRKYLMKRRTHAIAIKKGGVT